MSRTVRQSAYAGVAQKAINATQPYTWANSDRFLWNGSYEII